MKRPLRRIRKIILAHLMVMLCASLLTACGKAVGREISGVQKFGSQEANVEEIRFQSGKFRLVGDLRLPDGDEPHPAIIMVYGSGSATRDMFNSLIEIFLRNGFAVFSWDKPGSGESTGKLSDELSQRAEILVDGVEVLAGHPAINPDLIGLWGISQAGWVMPLAIDKSENINFMIVVSGGGEDSIEQMAYQIAQRVACDGGSAGQVALVEQYWSQRSKATSYDEYREAVEILMDIPGVKDYTGLKMTEEKEWKPLPRDWDMFINPMDVIEHTSIPVLAFFGELDRNIDPVQGAEAYEAALQKTGNQDFSVVLIPGVAHTLVPAETGCLNESWGLDPVPQYLETMEEWIKTHTK